MALVHDDYFWKSIPAFYRLIQPFPLVNSGKKYRYDSDYQ